MSAKEKLDGRTAWRDAKMMDGSKSFAIYANGHPRFLTKSVQRRLLRAGLDSAGAYNSVGSFVGGVEDRLAHVGDLAAEDVDEEASATGAVFRKARRLARRARRMQAGAATVGDSDDDDEGLCGTTNGRKRGSQGAAMGELDRRLLSVARASSVLTEPASEFMGEQHRQQQQQHGLPDEEGRAGCVVTLRMQAVRGREIPELSEGDTLVGYFFLGRAAAKGTGRKGTTRGGSKRDDDGDDASSQQSLSSDSSGDDAEDSSSSDSGSRSDERRKRRRRRRRGACTFRILSIQWGLMPYINLQLQGAAARRGGLAGRSSSRTRCFAVCELVRVGTASSEEA